MIILDPQDLSQSKLDTAVAGSTVRVPDPVAAGRASTSTLNLPDYETSQAQHSLLPGRLSKKVVDRRFWRATLVALAIYIGISVIVLVPYFAVTISKRAHRRSPPPPSPKWDLDLSSPNSEMIMVADEDMGKCNIWDTIDDAPVGKFSTANLLKTVSPSGSFSLRSNTSASPDAPQILYGTLAIDINPDKDEAAAVIAVSLQSTDPGLRKNTYVCLDATKSDTNLLIYVPHSITASDALTVNVTLLFPQSTSPITVKKFITYLPSFSQTFGDLNGHILFKKATIEGPQSVVHFDSIEARKLLVKTSLAAISGTFNISQSITLDTVGAPIQANITLVHYPNHDDPTFMSLDTGNSGIDAKITLLAPPISGMSLLSVPPPVFVAHTRTFNGSLSLDVSHDISTPPAPLHLVAQNNQAITNITLDSKFIGSFDVQTKLAEIDVNQAKDLTDPSGQGRMRTLLFDATSDDRRLGWVGWGKRPKKWDQTQGYVQIITALSPAILHLGS